MTEDEVFARLLPLVQEVTGARAEEIAPASGLVEDLGAESLDLLDLSFLIEEEFGITIEADEFEGQARQQTPDGIYDREGVLTEEALDELRKALPEVPPEKFTPGRKKIDVPRLLNVAVFVHLIQRKLAEAGREVSHAEG